MTTRFSRFSRLNVRTLPLSPDRPEITLVPGDIHFDQHDPAALRLMLLVARAARITRVVLVGDTFESAGISRHPRPVRKFRFSRGTIASEKAAATPYFEALKDIVQGTYGSSSGRLQVLTGNHERWWEGVQDEFPGLLDLPWYELYGDLFNGWHVWKEHTALKIGPLLVCHGHRLRGGLAKYPAASVLGNYPGQNTVFGHTHRVDSCTLPTFKYGKSVDHGAWTIGHLKDPGKEIVDGAIGPHSERHKQGFAIITHFQVKERWRFKLEQVTVDRFAGRPYCFWNGKIFGL